MCAPRTEAAVDAERRSQINALADRIRETLELSSYPVDVEEAVARLKGQIRDVEPPDAEAKIRKEGQGFVIELTPTSTDERRRFSIAHELGHLFLHMGYLIAPTKWHAINEYKDSPLYRFGFTEEEYEAHEFAGALLMPKHEFHRIAYNYRTANNAYNVGPLAAHFGVSLPAAKTRGRWLGLFAW
jgi:Zn-dependent peptidase ImmA (M78 family)